MENIIKISDSEFKIETPIPVEEVKTVESVTYDMTKLENVVLNAQTENEAYSASQAYTQTLIDKNLTMIAEKQAIIDKGKTVLEVKEVEK